MKRTIGTCLVVGWLVFTWGSEPAFPRGFGGGFRGGFGGGGFRMGGMAGGFGGGMRMGGFGGGIHAGGFGGIHPGGFSGMHAGGFGGAGLRTGNLAGGFNRAGTSLANRTPTFSNPSYRSRFEGNSRSELGNRGNLGSGIGNRADAGAGLARRPNFDSAIRDRGGLGSGLGNRGNLGSGIANRGGALGSGLGRSDLGNRSGIGNRTGIVNHAFSGNTLNVGNRTVNMAGAGYRPSYYNHGWYHGYWNGNYGRGYGWGGAYWYHPLGWGWGAWGLGYMMYNCGYLGYYNPYYYANNSSTAVYNYSQPIPVDPQAGVAAAGQDTAGQDAGNPEDQLDPAIAAFKKGNYDSALDLVDQAIQKKPTDAVMHEFRGLVLFAKHDYQQAAATIHSVLALGPGWDWTTLSSLYDDINVYHRQFGELETFVQNHPQDGAAHFLLAYHYLTCGAQESAITQLQQVVKLVSNDKVAADLLKMLSPPKDDSQQPPTADSPVPQPAAKPIDAAALVGTWRAARNDGSNFELSLTGDSKFNWKFSRQKVQQEFSGTYSLEGNLLVLERQAGGSLIGELTSSNDQKFNFKMLGAPGDDPGLDFAR